MKFTDISYPWSEQKNNTKKLRLKANRPFIFMHHPKNWELIYTKDDSDKSKKKTKPLLVPNFSTLRLEPGVNNVRSTGGGIQIHVAIAKAEERGFTVIKPEHHDYLKVYPALNGKYYADKFTEFEQYGNSLISNFDFDSYNDFRKNLVRDGHIALPHLHFIRVLLNANRKLINKYSQLTHNPNHKAMYNKALQKDKDLKEAIKKIKDEGVDYYA
tara:strand:+ start:357 stop:998 length:642 start_codon:yes stop_codon:yes gene_type:complete